MIGVVMSISMIFDVSELERQEKYNLLNGGVTPRPIAWISTRSSDDVDNLAPYSFFTVFYQSKKTEHSE